MPAIVVTKDPVLLYASWRKYGNSNTRDFIKYYRARMEATVQAQAAYPERVLLVRYEDLVRDTEATVMKMFRHLGFAPVYGDTFDNDWPTKVQGDAIVDDIDERIASVPRLYRRRIRASLG